MKDLIKLTESKLKLFKMIKSLNDELPKGHYLRVSNTDEVILDCDENYEYHTSLRFLWIRTSSKALRELGMPSSVKIQDTLFQIDLFIDFLEKVTPEIRKALTPPVSAAD